MPDEPKDRAARILICQHQTQLAENWARTLTDLGYQAAGTVSTGEDAVRVAEQVKPDLILMDIKLHGEIGGIDSAEQIRSRFDIPVVYVTGYAEKDIFERAMMTEPYGYLGQSATSLEVGPTIATALYKHKADKELKESEALYKALVETTDTGYLIIDQDGRVLGANSEYVRLTGHENVAEIRGRSVVEWTAEHDRIRNFEEVKKCIERGFVRNLEIEYVDKSGNFTPIEINATVASISGASQIVALCRDITGRKQVEEALRQSEERYRMLFENANDGIFVAQDGVLKSPNARLAWMTGYDLEEITEQPFTRFIHPEDAEMVFSSHHERVTGALGLPSNYQFRVIRKHGNAVWVELNTTLINWEGRPATLNVLRDITDRKQAEEALRENEKRYRELVENANDLIYQSDSRGIVTLANPRVLKIGGYKKEEFIGKHYLEFVHPGYRADVERFYGIQFVKKIPTTYYELPVLTKHQETFWVGQSVQLVMQGDAVVGFQVIARDITERKRAEQALVESERRFREVLERVDLLTATIDAEGQIIFCNDFLLRLTGWQRDEVIGKNWFEVFVGGDEREARLRAHFGFMKEGVIPVHRENKIVKRDGSPCLIKWTNTLLHDLDGKVIGTTGIGEDITEKRQADEALRESEEKYRKILETIADGYHETDLKGNLTLVNDSLCRIMGYSREELVGLSYRRIMDEQNAKLIFNAYDEVFRTGKANPGFGYQIIRKDGKKRDAVVSVALIRDTEGNPAGFRGIFRDVTDQNRLQRQLLEAQKMEAIGTLAGGIAHDFNNLLQAILGYSDLLLMKKAPGDPDRKKLEVIQHAARDGADLVSRILMVSRKAESKVRPVDLNEEIRRVEKLLRRTLPKMIQIDLVLGEDLRIIDADPAQIEQVLLNLAVNARHAMPNGGQRLIETKNVSASDPYLRKHREATPGHYVLLTVSDTGVGMEPEVLDRIFEPFFTTKTNAGGTGLGLSMVHGIVSQHGGYIRCYSEPGRGTSFKIYFPVSVSESISDLAMTREMPAFGTETILLVDDDDRVREMGRQMIEMGGYKVLIARSGEEALEMYTSYRGEISLIILDLIMPGMGGSRCLEELIRIDPDVKVLVASGYSANGLTTDQKGRGARGFFRKPYDAKDILMAIRRVLDKGQL